MDVVTRSDEEERHLRRFLLRVVVSAVAFVGAAFVLASVASSLDAAPAGAVITGVDVASYQHPGGASIDWRKVAGAGHRFGYVKATEGTSYTNPWFASDYAGIAAAGMYRGAYHYARPALPLTTAEGQARYFVSVAGTATGGLDLPLELDLEETGGLGQADLAEWTRRFLAEVTRLTGKRPLVYTGRWFWQGSIGGYGNDIGQNYRLWTADYRCQRVDGSLWCDPNTDTYNPPVYGGWGQWTFWQNYSVGAVPGIIGSVDMNRFCCDVGSLAALAGGGGAGGSPFGLLHSISVPEATYVNVYGWAIDPDTRDPITVHVYVDGQGWATTANGPFPGLADVYPGYGGDHGFFLVAPVPLGARQVCAYGINVGSGGHSLLGCMSLGGDPIGALDTATAAGPGRIDISGWAIDPNGTTPTAVVARVNGVETRLTADRQRPDLAGYGQGTAHGFSGTVTSPSGGPVQVCVSAENSVGPGGTTSLGCRTVNLPGGSPQGVVDTAVGGMGSISISGWVVDPDTAASIDVHVYVDGVGTALRADGIRNDVGAGYPGYGSAHGYSGTVSARSGTRTVCAYGINVGVGGNVLLGCRTVQVVGGAPFGALDTVTYAGTSIDVTGWAVDPDTASPIPVHVYLDNQGYAFTANQPRPDLASGLPLQGSDHGFSGPLPAPDGTHTVCAYAIDVRGGDGNRLLGCRTVTVPPGNPRGWIDTASIVGGNVSLSGWALDPNTVDPTYVHVYVNGVGFEVRADGNRPDVGAAFGLGSAHGWSFTGARVGGGVQHVCVYALNIVGSGSHQLLGCRDLS